MQHRLVFDIWVYRRDSDAVRYLILRTSVEKAQKWFNGGRFWQIPSNLLADGDTLVPAVRRCLDSYGIDAAAIWAVESASDLDDLERAVLTRGGRAYRHTSGDIAFLTCRDPDGIRIVVAHPSPEKLPRVLVDNRLYA